MVNFIKNKFNPSILLIGCATFFCFLISTVVLYAQDDTIGFWKITENGNEISALTLNNEPTYLLGSLSDSSDMKVYYYTESPCKTCLCKLEVRDTVGVALRTIERKGYGDNIPFSFSGKELKAWMPLGKGRVYLYFSGKYDGWMPWIFLGAVKCAPVNVNMSK